MMFNKCNQNIELYLVYCRLGSVCLVIKLRHAKGILVLLREGTNSYDFAPKMSVSGVQSNKLDAESAMRMLEYLPSAYVVWEM